MLKTLQPIKPKTSYAEEVEKILIKFVKRFYLEIIGNDEVNNSNNVLEDAIFKGRIYFTKNGFSGKFNSKISKSLQGLGAEWDRKQGRWKIPLSKLPANIVLAIKKYSARNDRRIKSALDRLEKTAAKNFISATDFNLIVGKMVNNVDAEVVRGIKRKKLTTVQVQLDDQQKDQLKEEYSKNFELQVKDWSDREVNKLRKKIMASYSKGVRYESIVDDINTEYETKSRKHAKFLAGQETRLINSKIKELQYRKAGMNRYIWRTRNNPTGFDKGNVRPDHAVLDGTIHDWDNPPITNKKTGARNHPGQDFNCFCFAEVIIE